VVPSKRFFVFLLAALCCLQGFAQADSRPLLKDLVGDHNAKELASGKMLSQVSFRNWGKLEYKYLPEFPLAKEEVAKIDAEKKPDIAGEALTFIPRKAAPGEAYPAPLSEAEWGLLFTKAAAFTTLAGLEYYSATEDKINRLYSRSERIVSPDDLTPLEDPVWTAPPPDTTFYVFQRDNMFLENTYTFTYASRPGALLVVQQNLSTLKLRRFLNVTAVHPHNMNTLIMAIETKEGVLIYINSLVKPIVVIFRNQMSKSFGNRAVAIIGWFTNNVKAALQ
jgi:hypothetical protein